MKPCMYGSLIEFVVLQLVKGSACSTAMMRMMLIRFLEEERPHLKIKEQEEKLKVVAVTECRD